MALRAERDICIFSGVLVRSGRPRIQTIMLQHELANSVQISVTSRQSAVNLISRGRLLREAASIDFLLLVRQQVLLNLLRVERVRSFFRCLDRRSG